MSRKHILLALGLAAAAFLLVGVAEGQSPILSPLEELGKALYFDHNLSDPPGQACASCHAPEAGFVGPESLVNENTAVYPGAVPTRFGNRRPPTSAYADGGSLFYDPADGLWIGGTFWDGRATGWVLGDPLAEQARGPFLNPVEQNLSSPAAACAVVQTSPYAGMFEQVWGIGSLDCGAGVDATYEKIARSIAAFERSAEVNPFSSKYDFYLKGEANLTGKEKKGLDLFEGKGMCALCHLNQPGPIGEPPMFTDFTYDNLGIPKNPMNPFYTMPPWINPDGAAWVDNGLGAFLAGAGYPTEVYEPEMGKEKVPTLRNVDLRPYNGFVKVYGHNGYFKSLQSIVHFYNTRDVLPSCGAIKTPKEGANCWPAAEQPMNVNHDELGNLGLKPHEEEALVEFLKTLSDGYRP
jgi:cytochrome c peroxidase